MRRHSLGFAILALAAAWAPSAAASCTLGRAGTTQRVAIGATGRSMLLRVPAKLKGRAPLVFVLHGSTGDGASILAQSKLEGTAERHGFLLAAPDGGIPVDRGFVWNIPGVPTVTGKVPGPDDADDVAFIRTAIDWLVAQGCADSTRVYASGWSGGGRLTSWLGCVASDKLAASAPVVGLRAGHAAGERAPPTGSGDLPSRQPGPGDRFRRGQGRHQPDPGRRRGLLAIFDGYRAGTLGGACRVPGRAAGPGSRRRPLRAALHRLPVAR